MPTFYVIRATKDSPKNYYNQFKKGWFASNNSVSTFENAKIFNTLEDASKFIKSCSDIGFRLNKSEYFEVVPVTIQEPEWYSCIYSVGDFVFYNEGMGEAAHGTIVAIGKHHVDVNVWSYDTAKYPEFIMSVHSSDLRGKSTVEDAMAYHLMRNGKISA